MVKIAAAPISEGASYHLRAIYLKHAESFTANDFDPTIGTVGLEPLFRTSNLKWECGELSVEDASKPDQSACLRTCTITFRFEFVYLDPKKGAANTSDNSDLPEDAVVAKIIADISTAYAVAREPHPTDDEISTWAHNNSILHAWPYWREYCHSTMLRMGLPVTMMPLVQRAQAKLPDSPSMTAPSTPVKKKSARPKPVVD